MPRKSKKDVDLEDLVDDEPPTIEPYTILGIDKSATADEIKKAYRMTALKHHPDKAPEHLKDEATIKFQEVAFAYAVLSDPVRRKRYDSTGSTAESIDFEDFSWSEFYSEQFRDVITTASIESFSKGYKNSTEEKDDLLAAYTKYKGKWSGIYQVIMLSDPLEDEDRFRKIIDVAIEKGEVEKYKAYAEETEKAKEKRMKNARAEAEEAEEHAKTTESRSKKKGGKKESDLSDLAALISKRQATRGSFLDQLEAKARAEQNPKKGKGKKRATPDEWDDEEKEEDLDMPDEEAFQSAAAKLKKGKENRKSESGRRSKRTKQ